QEHAVRRKGQETLVDQAVEAVAIGLAVRGRPASPQRGNPVGHGGGLEHQHPDDLEDGALARYEAHRASSGSSWRCRSLSTTSITRRNRAGPGMQDPVVQARSSSRVTPRRAASSVCPPVIVAACSRVWMYAAFSIPSLLCEYCPVSAG